MRDFKLKNNVTIEVTDEVFLAIRSSRYKERYAEKRDEKQALKMFEIEKIAKGLHRFIASENDFYISKIGKWN